MKFQIFDRFLENNQISIFMKIRLVGTKTFQKWTDRYEKSNGRFLKFCNNF